MGNGTNLSGNPTYLELGRNVPGDHGLLLSADCFQFIQRVQSVSLTVARFLSHAYLLESLKIFDDVASRKHSNEVVSLHDRHLINSVPAHLFQCCP